MWFRQRLLVKRFDGLICSNDFFWFRVTAEAELCCLVSTFNLLLL